MREERLIAAFVPFAAARRRLVALPECGRPIATGWSASARCGGCGAGPPRCRPPPAAGTRRSRRPPGAWASTPRLIRYFTTEVARALDSSQLEGNCGLAMGARVGVAVDLQGPVDLLGNASAPARRWPRPAGRWRPGPPPSWWPGRRGTAPRTGTRSGRRRRGCPCGRAAARAGGRRSRSDSAAAPAPGGPARR